MLVAEIIKNRGSVQYSAQNFNEASHEYEQALSIFRYIENKNPNWKNSGIIDDDLVYVDTTSANPKEQAQLNDFKLKIYLNLAICYLKIKNYIDSIESCNEALALDPKNVKALFRRSKARTVDINSDEPEFQIAIQDLQQALLIAPDD